MKSVLVSIQPKWCELIASGKKTIEVRKTKPKLDTPFKVYIYCTKPKYYYKVSSCLVASDESLWLSNDKVKMCDGFEFWAENAEYECLNRKVIGEFVCDKMIDIDYGIEEGVYFDGEFQEGFETNGNGDNPTCLSFIELENYLTENEGYGWHISNLVIYNKPRELGEFFYACNKPKSTDCSVCIDHRENKCKAITGPPQSWCYVESESEQSAR